MAKQWRFEKDFAEELKLLREITGGGAVFKKYPHHFILVVLCEMVNCLAKATENQLFYAMKDLWLKEYLVLYPQYCSWRKSWGYNEVVVSHPIYGVTSFHLPALTDEELMSFNLPVSLRKWHGLFRQGAILALVQDEFRNLELFAQYSLYPSGDKEELGQLNDLLKELAERPIRNLHRW